MNSTTERVLSYALTLAAVAIAVTMVHREFFAAPPTSPLRASAIPVKEPRWEEVVSSGRLLAGSRDAPVTIVEFSDLECPFCKRFHEKLRALRAAHGDSIGIIFHQFPLTNHRFALPAARAAECAGAQQKFGEFLDQAFMSQDSLGLKSFSEMAKHAGVRDSAAFAKCSSATASWPSIDAGLALGEKLNVTGTPTVIINGMRYGGVPSDSVLSRLFASGGSR